jgi:hypothetical protein
VKVLVLSIALLAHADDHDISGPGALARLQDDAWPAASTVTEVCGSWAAAPARAEALQDA